jgi:hypothetical protein
VFLSLGKEEFMHEQIENKLANGFKCLKMKIGAIYFDKEYALLEAIKPQYIFLKPRLLGGFQASEEWLIIAKQLGIDWWATSALESNIALNTIAQWTACQETKMYQGLGTGSNIEGPLENRKGKLWLNDGSLV